MAVIDKTIFRPGWEALDQPIYDRQVYPAGALCERLTFFQHPVGAFDGAKSYVDTNMELASSLPKGKEFLVQGISIAMPDADDESRMNLYWKGVVVLILGSKVYVRRPLIAFAETNQISVEKAPLLIVSELNFALEIDWPVPFAVSKPVRVCADLIGMTYRRAY